MANCVPSRVDSATKCSFTASPSHAAAWGLVVLAGASMERGGEGLPDSSPIQRKRFDIFILQQMLRLS